MDDEAAVDATEMSRILGVSPATVHRYAQTGEIPAFRVGKRWRFFPSKVIAHLEAPLDIFAQPPRAKAKKNFIKPRTYPADSAGTRDRF